MSINIAGHAIAPWPSSTANQTAAVLGIGTVATAATIAIRSHEPINALGPLLAGAVVAGGAWGTSRLMAGTHMNPFGAALSVGLGAGAVAGVALGALASSPHLGGDGEIGPIIGICAFAAIAAGSVIGATVTAIKH